MEKAGELVISPARNFGRWQGLVSASQREVGKAVGI